MARDYTTILYREEGPVGVLTLNRPHDGNMFTAVTCDEVRDCLEAVRRETRTRVVVITGAGDKFFCIGGHHDTTTDTKMYPAAPSTLEMYEAIERLQKPVIASVNGFAVGGGHVLHVVCDLTIAKESAIFRQVGPMVGSFDAGYGTWYLEDIVGKKKAKEIWMMNEKLTAAQALELGLVNKVVPDAELWTATMEMANTIASRGSYALAAIKHAFVARHGGAQGLSRLTHDMMLPFYYSSEEAQELSQAFKDRRPPDPDKFGK